MIYHAVSIDQAIHGLQAMKRAGATHVGTPADLSAPDGPLDFLTIDLVWVDPATGMVVGDEANDYEPKPGEVCVARIL